MASKDIPKNKLAPKTKGISSSSSLPVCKGTKLGTDSGLNSGRDVIKNSSTFESKTEKLKVPRRKFGLHSGIKFKFEKPVIPNSAIFQSRSDREKEHATSVDTVTMQIVENKTYKEESTISGTGKRISTLEEDEKFVRVRQIDETIHKTKSSKNVNDTKTLTESEIEGLCSTVATAMRVLQPQPQTSKISKSHSRNTLNLQGVTSSTSKLPLPNARQISIGQAAELKESASPTRQNKYGFHAGLRFSFNGKNAKPLDFIRTPSLRKKECFKKDKRDPVF